MITNKNTRMFLYMIIIIVLFYGGNCQSKGCYIY